MTHMVADWFRRTTVRSHVQPQAADEEALRRGGAQHRGAARLLAEIDGGFIIQAKQLYHDREEITVHVYNKFWVSKLSPSPEAASGTGRKKPDGDVRFFMSENHQKR